MSARRRYSHEDHAGEDAEDDGQVLAAELWMSTQSWILKHRRYQGRGVIILGEGAAAR